MRVSIREAEDAIKTVFGESVVKSVDSVYEAIEGSDDLKLVIFINDLKSGDVSVIYTKVILICNSGKEYLTTDTFSYLYDINCVYRKVKFGDAGDISTKLGKIVKDKKFGDDILILSKFVENPAYLVNNWFRDNKVKDVSVSNISYDPLVSVMPCDSLSFNFNMTVNEVDEVTLTIRKNGDNVFDYSFKFYDKTVNVSKDNLASLVATVADTIKNNI